MEGGGGSCDKRQFCFADATGRPRIRCRYQEVGVYVVTYGRILDARLRPTTETYAYGAVQRETSVGGQPVAERLQNQDKRKASMLRTYF